jgi:CheY-like chemotaxis protein
MSLVGNLADLGLGEILQIISLSQKSGTLQLATAADTASIGFVQGKVVFAHRDQSPLTVTGMLVERKLINATQMQEMSSLQSNKPHAAQSQPPVMWETFGISIDDVETGLRAQIETLVYEMFTWDEGNFSFVVADEPKALTRLTLSSNVFTVMRGLNPQFLAMEGSRLRDERDRSNPVEPAKTAAPPQQGAQPSEAAETAPATPTIEPPAEALVVSSVEVVLIDDDPNLLRLLRERLLREFSTVSVFTKVDAGLKRTRELLWANKRVVVISDLILPRSDGAGILGGLEVLEKIRPDYPQVPVFLLTDFPNEEATTKARALSVNALVSKPRRAELEKDKSMAVLDVTTNTLMRELQTYLQAHTEEPNTGVPAPDEDLSFNTERIAPIARSVAPPQPEPELEAEAQADAPEEAQTDAPEEEAPQEESTQRIEPIERSKPVEAEATPYPLGEAPLAALSDDDESFTLADESGPPASRENDFADLDVGAAPTPVPEQAEQTSLLIDTLPAPVTVAAASPVFELSLPTTPLTTAPAVAEALPVAEPALLEALPDVPDLAAKLDAEMTTAAAPLAVVEDAAPVLAPVAAPIADAFPNDADEGFDVSFDDDEPAALTPPAEPLLEAPPTLNPVVDQAVIMNADPMGLVDLSREIGLELSQGSAAGTEQDRTMLVLKSLLFELMSPANRDTIMLLVLRYASELFSRSVLLLVARDELWGLGGYAHQVKNVDFISLVRRLRVRLDPDGAISQVVKTKATNRAVFGASKLERDLAQKLGIDPEQPIFIAPLVSADRVAAILLGDNQQMGKDVGDTHGLEIFLLQAGMAMERALLERRLRELARNKSGAP